MIPLYKPFMPETPLITDILQSGKLSYGKYGKEFELKLSNFIGVDNLIVTNTFNMAILVALTTLGLKAGDSVVVSPMACLASTQPLLSLGIKVVWSDVDPLTGTLCPDSVRSLINKKPKAIIHNHFCGYPGHIDEINEIGEEFGIPVIDDGIEAFGSKYKGNKIGNTNTDVTIFSFNPVRIPNTLDGGAIIFKDKTLLTKAKLIRDAGIDRTIFRDELGEISPKCDILLVGHSATPMEVNTYIGVQQMNHVEELLSKQYNNSLKWDSLFLNDTKITPLKRKDTEPNYWVYGMLVENKNQVISNFRDQGYYASGVHINNNQYSVFKDRKVLKGVNKFMNSFVALPSGWWVDLKNK
jgi:dTDP-4-amino-4,6-dideoxygalactose transaminase